MNFSDLLALVTPAGAAVSPILLYLYIKSDQERRELQSKLLETLPATVKAMEGMRSSMRNLSAILSGRNGVGDADD